MPEDSDAQEKRAERLRAEIERLKAGGDEEKDESPPSPREFIEKRMRELDEGQDDAESPPTAIPRG